MDRSLGTDVVAILVVVGLLGTSGAVGLAGAVQAGAEGPETTLVSQPSATSGAPRIAVTARRPADGGPIEYDLRVSELATAGSVWILLEDGRVDALAGATPTDHPTRYRWDGAAPVIEATLRATGGRSADGSLALARSDWAFGPVPDLAIAWRPSGGGAIERVRPFTTRQGDRVRVRAAGGGLVGERFAMVGDMSVRTRSTDDGTVRLAVPDPVDPRPDPAAIADSIADAATSFEDGAGRETATVFALPPSVRDGGATFISADEGWINADARLRTANNVWLHEYVHTRQSFDLGPRMRWFDEASAEYFGARLALDVGLVSRSSFRSYLAGRSGPAGTLADRDSWRGDGLPYHRGVRVLSALDREIRSRTDGARSLEDVFARLNRHRGTVTYAEFARTVSAVVGEDMRPWLDRYIEDTQPVAVPAGGLTATIDDPATMTVGLVGLTALGGVTFRRRPWH